MTINFNDLCDVHDFRMPPADARNTMNCSVATAHLPAGAFRRFASRRSHQAPTWA